MIIFSNFRRTVEHNTEKHRLDYSGPSGEVDYELKITHCFTVNNKYAIELIDCIANSRHFKEIYVADGLFHQCFHDGTEYECTGNKPELYPLEWADPIKVKKEIISCFSKANICQCDYVRRGLYDIIEIMFKVLPEFVGSKHYYFTDEERVLFASQYDRYRKELAGKRALWNLHLPKLFSQEILRELRKDLHFLAAAHYREEFFNEISKYGAKDVFSSYITTETETEKQLFFSRYAILKAYSEHTGSNEKYPGDFTSDYLDWVADTYNKENFSMTDNELKKNLIHYLTFPDES